MTGAEFYAYVLRKFKRTDKSTEVYEAISDVIADIKIRYMFEDFKTITTDTTINVAGEYKFAVPATFGHLIGPVLKLDPAGNSVPLIKLDKEGYDRLYPYPDDANVTKGTPKHFCLYGEYFYIGPVPDDLTLSYRFNHTTGGAVTVTSGTADVSFSGEYRNYLRSLVLAELYFGMGNDEEGSKWQALGEPGIEKMVANEKFNTDAPKCVKYNDL